MSPNTSSTGILSTCTKCKRLYWSNGFCSHGMKRPVTRQESKPPIIKKMK